FLLADLKCNFDSDLCGFLQLSGDNFDWVKRSGSTPSGETGPTSDHTSGSAHIPPISAPGYYMYMEASNPRKQGENAIMDKTITFGGATCLTFYYHMLGQHMGTLNVFVGSRRLFSKSGDQGSQWHLAELSFVHTGDDKVWNLAIRGSEYQGDIAIDDIKVISGACGSTRKCDFDVDVCGFVQDTQDVFDWTRMKGNTGSSGTGPIGDHTSGKGRYSRSSDSDREIP
ncbi:predicted protein, partial [Nematostella vectensis]